MNIRMFDDNRDIDDFLELFKICFGKSMSKEYFEWKYLKNPFRLEIHPIIVMEENSRLIGAQNKVFGRMMINGNIIYTTQGTDVMVHPEFRERGFHLELQKCSKELYRESQYKLHYVFPGKMSYKNSLRFGRRPIYEITRHWKVLNAREVFNKAFHNPILRKTGGLLSPLLWNKTRIPKLRNKDVTVKTVSDVKVLEDVYNRWKSADKLHTIRDEKYLNWRFKSHPKKEYQFLAAYVGQEVKGYFVIGEREVSGIKMGTIVDYLVVDDDPNIFEPLLNYSLDVFKANNYIFVVAWVFTQKWAQPVIEDYGFISSRNIIIRRRHSYDYLLAQPWDEKNFPYDLTSIPWYITPSDVDTW